MDKLAAGIIESANFWLLIVAAFSLWRACVWKLDGRLTEHNKWIVTAWVVIFTGAAANAGWFAMSRHLSAADERWNLTMFEWRWMAVFLTVGVFVAGMLMFIQAIDGYSTLRMGIIGVSTFLMALAMGYY
jgi:hypothetical protein